MLTNKIFNASALSSNPSLSPPGFIATFIDVSVANDELLLYLCSVIKH